MISIESTTEFFGWLTIANIGIYVLTAVGIASLRGFMVSMNTRIFGIAADDVRRMSFAYVAAYKLAITLFAFTPWLALKLMA